MKRVIGLLVVLLFVNTTVFGQKLAPKDRIKLQEANNAYSQMAYEEAVGLYRAVYNKNLSNPFVNYRMGMCLLELQDYADAITFFEATQAGSLKKKNSDFYFGFGMAYLKLGDYDNGLAKFKEFIQKGSSSWKKLLEPEKFVAQCEFAISAKLEPVSVTIENLGDSINSKYDDYHPALSLDGKKFMFSSKRLGSTGGEQLVDGQYYSDVYESVWNQATESWSKAKQVEGALNSKGFDDNGAQTADGKGIYLYRNIDSENKKFLTPTGGGDIYFSKMGTTGRWSAPQIVEGINSATFDGGASITADGNTIYFISSRFGLVAGRGAQGGWDIWTAKKQEDGTWGKPVNLGDKINTPYDERTVFIHPNGKTLFFASEGHFDKNMGGYDIFRSELVNGEWTEPVNLGYPINTHKDEKEIAISVDGEVAWLSTIRGEEKKDFDIYEVDLKFYNVLTGESELLSILKGKVVDASTGLPLQAKITFVEDSIENGEVITLNSSEDGDYINTFVSHKTYLIKIEHKGYETYTKRITLKAPKPKKKRRRTTTNRRRKQQSAAKTYTVELNLELKRNNPIEVVSKDLFKRQIISFEKNETGFDVTAFSKNILELYARQYVQSPSIELAISGHFSEDDDANIQSKILADKVIAFLIKNGVDQKAIKVTYLGDTEPLADNATEVGKAANRRVEIMIVL